MTVESAADRASFISGSEFGVSASLDPTVGPLITLSGIFDADHLMIETGESQVSTTAPMFLCRTSDLATLTLGNAREGDALTIASALYIVRDVQADGTGMTTLIMEKQ